MIYSFSLKLFDKILYVSTAIIAIFVLVSIISLGFFTWPKANDFIFVNDLKTIGIFPYALYRYNNWDGRAISMGITQTFFLKYLSIEIINVIWAGCLVLAAHIALKIFLYVSRMNKKVTIPDYFIATAIFSSVLWYGFKPHLSDTVYWASGGVYIMSFLFAVIWLYLWIKIFSTSKTIHPFQQILFSLFTLYVGALTQNLSCAVLVYMGIEMIKAVLKKDIVITKRSLFLILLIITGLLVISMAPGNFIRATYGPQNFIINFSMLSMNYIKTFMHFMELSLTLFALLLISIPLLIIFTLYSSQYSIKKNMLIHLKQKYTHFTRSTTVRQKLIYFLSRFQLLSAALASILPFSIIPGFTTPRTSLYFMGFIFFWTYFEILPFILRQITIQKIYKTKPKSSLPYMLITISLLAILSIVSSHIFALHQIKKQILKREKILETFSHKNVDVITYSIDKTKLPFSYTFQDIRSDKNHWINQATATGYELKSIRTNDDIIPVTR